MDRLKIGIIGLGGIAQSVHIPSLLDIADTGSIHIKAVCDCDLERAIPISDTLNASFYSNHVDMLKNESLDGIFILTWPDQTFRIAKDVLEQKIHTFIEKPAGITLFQTKCLENLSKENNVHLQVGMNRRYIPLIRQVIKRMNELTTITHIEGCFIKNADASFYDGCESAFICDTIHAIDILSQIANCEAKACATVINRCSSKVDNSWNSVIKFSNGMTGILKANYKTGARVHTFELHGENASCYINIGFGKEECSAKILRSNQGTFSLSSTGEGDLIIEEYDGKKIANSESYYRYYGYYDEDLAFINSIKTNQKSICDISQSVKSMELAQFILANKL